jgi:hypothetical protein
VWTEGVLTLLPQADVVIFVRADSSVAGSVPWERVREVAGDLMEPLDMYPKRFRVERFPSPEQLAALAGQQ